MLIDKVNSIMRRRDLILNVVYVFLGLVLVSFLLYTPVLFAWANRGEHLLDSAYEREQIGADRQLVVPTNWCINSLPWIYSRLLVLHAGWNGWMYDSLSSYRGVYLFVPDDPETRDRQLRRWSAYPALGDSAPKP